MWPPLSVRAGPETSVPSGASTRTAFGAMVTGPLNVSRTSVGGTSTRDCVTGTEDTRVT
jgi:hypothetical protein